VLSTWNGRIFLVSVSKATTSESMTKLSVPGLMTLGIIVMRSGYFVVLSSELRLKILMEPSGNRWICQRFVCESAFEKVCVCVCVCEREREREREREFEKRGRERGGERRQEA
jgi:hypothetical protein